MTTYVTTSMDTWDIISKKVYGDEHFIDALIAANLEHRKVVFFSAGVELNVPVEEVCPIFSRLRTATRRPTRRMKSR